MTVLITLTTAGADAGPFNLFSNLDGFTTPFESNVNKAALMVGYSSALVPDFTNVIKVVSLQGCVNFIDINVTYPTTSTSSTTTTSTSSTTTTTTTAIPLFGIKLTVAHVSSAAACADGATLVPTWYATSDPIIASTIIYNNPDGTGPFAGGGNWYHAMPQNAAIQINGSGIVISVVPC